MPQTPKPGASLRKSNKTADIPWLARLTHPLVFFGAALAVYEGTIGTALLIGKHSDSTIIWLCVLMAVVIIAAMGTVALLVFKKPEHLMLTPQDTIGEELRITSRVRKATKLLVAMEAPKTPSELLELMDDLEAVLLGGAE